MRRGVIGNKAKKQFGLRLAALLVAVPVGWTTYIWSGAGAIADEKGVAAFQTINSQELAEMLRHKDFPLVNVHIPYEGEIAQTDAFIPFDQIVDHLDQLPTDKTAVIVLYCRSGRMSEIAAGELAALGYTDVSHLSGGMIDWERSGQALLRR